MPIVETYTRYVIQSFLPAAGWQAAYWQDETHIAWAVHALAHIQERTYNAKTWKRVPSSVPDDEIWDISGVTYVNPDDGWSLCIEDSNFCGLLPPGKTLQQFLTTHNCHQDTQRTKEKV